MGCSLLVTGENGDLTVTGNTCGRGKAYALTECTAPVRRFTGTIRLLGGDVPVLPVKTDHDIPKESLFAVAEVCRQLRVSAPVRIGEVVCGNVAGTGAALVSLRSVGI